MISRTSSRAALGVSTLLVSIAVAQVGPAAAQGEQFAIRVIGITKMDTSKPVINRVVVSCVTPGTNQFVDCIPAGEAVLKVDSATKKKLKLASAVIAKGPITARTAGGEGEDGGFIDAEASKSVRAKLKKAKSVKVTYSVSVTGPIAEVVKKKVTLTTQSDDIERLLLRSSGDTFAISGGGRG